MDQKHGSVTRNTAWRCGCGRGQYMYSKSKYPGFEETMWGKSRHPGIVAGFHSTVKFKQLTCTNVHQQLCPKRDNIIILTVFNSIYIYIYVYPTARTLPPSYSPSRPVRIDPLHAVKNLVTCTCSYISSSPQTFIRYPAKARTLARLTSLQSLPPGRGAECSTSEEDKIPDERERNINAPPPPPYVHTFPQNWPCRLIVAVPVKLT